MTCLKPNICKTLKLTHDFEDLFLAVINYHTQISQNNVIFIEKYNKVVVHMYIIGSLILQSVYD